MKSSNKSSFIIGAVLLLLAAMFSICLILQPLDFGAGSPGHNNLFYALGHMLVCVYGISSVLIPIFLMIAGLSCFATTWTAAKTMRLLTALLPFYTAVLTEKICRSVLGQGTAGTIKTIIAAITGLMLVLIEIIGAGVIADTVNEKIFYRNRKHPSPDTSDSGKNFAYTNEKNADNKNQDNIQENSQADKTDDSSSEAQDDKVSFEPIKKNSAFDKALAKLDIKNDDESFNELVNEAENLYNQDIPSIEDYENIDAVKDSPAVSDSQAASDEISDESTELSDKTNSEPENNSATQEKASEPAADTNNGAAISAEQDDEPKNPASIITQEEYAALINPITEEAEEAPKEDELEWPNLPPAPETLPPEYDEDAEQTQEIDENDPALQFPPVDEAESEVQESEIPSTNAETTKADPTVETAYSSANYAQKIAEPDYPSGIVIHDDEPSAQEIKKEKKTEPKPQYPSGIHFWDDDSAFSQTENEPLNENEAPSNEEQSDGIQYDEINFDEDETLEQTEEFVKQTQEFIDETQDDNQIEETYDNRPAETTEIPAAQDDFQSAETDEDDQNLEAALTNFDNLFDEPAEENAAEAPAQPETEVENEVEAESDVESEPEDEDFGIGSSVFADMDADIRAKMKLNHAKIQAEAAATQAETDEEQSETAEADEQNSVAEPAATTTVEEQTETEEQTSAAQSAAAIEQNSAEEVNQTYDNNLVAPDPILALNPNAGHANNLTADELSDFFNAQQQQNTPKTKQIVAAPKPVSQRAGKKGPYVIPSDLLTAYKDDQYWIIDEGTKQASLNLKQTLAEFGIEAEIIGIKKGPVVTMFELLPAPGVKLSKIVALQDNIALSLAAQSVRIVAPIPGKQAVGIEVPNKHRSVVGFREIIEMDLPEWDKMAVPVILGKDILGKAQLIDLTKTPHMLIAGATGSGKSVCVNSLILSILYKRSYKDVKLILVDPKVVELKLYNNIPHLLTPVITEPKKALAALQYCLCEMERRYSLLDGLGVRDIASYNQRIKERNICAEKLPYIVVIIDEFADLMATSGKELENTVARLTAMSRAVGIHLVLATQRPSVNVITGLIKANIPSRIAFMVASRTDSNIIIDSVGAEKLLGRGDMLYASAVDPAPVRIQGTFVSDQEVEDVVNAVKEYGEPDYVDEDLMFGNDEEDEDGNVDLFGNDMDEDPLYDQALEIVVQAGKASASYIQRRLKIGYNRAARLVEEMEERGIVGPANGSKPREIIHVP